MKKYAIILFSLLFLAGFVVNAQNPIKRSQKSKTEKPKEAKSKSEKTKDTKPQTEKTSNSSKKKKPQKTETTSKSKSSSSSHSTVRAARSVESTAFDVTFSCNVNDADMYIDGYNYGRPNGTCALITGSHQVKLIAKGYEDYTTTIQVKAGNTSFDFKMTKIVPIEPYVPKVETITVKGVSFDMVFVEGDTFTMGATSEQGVDAKTTEKPAHQVMLSDYYIGKCEVTQALWQAVMGSNPSAFKGDLQRPVECISWDECQTFITKLNQMTGKVFRLPTEAEWEYAARGGNRSRGYEYSGSDDPGGVAWYAYNSVRTTYPVGTKSPNELGLYDMSGNVTEWCQDRYGEYSSSPQTNPTGPTSGSERVNRGGGWFSGAAVKCRVSSRDSHRPSFSYSDLGLRLAASSL